MLSKEGKWLSYFELDSIMKNTKNLDGDINYKLLKAQCSQQILRVLDKNIKGYYKSVQDYKKHPNKYKGKPCLPCYRKRGSEFYLCYTNQSCKIKYGKIVLSKSLSIGIPQYEKYSDLIKDFNQVRIKPLNKGYKVEIIYEVKDTETLGIRSFIVNNSRAIRRRLFPDLEDYEHIGYDGGSRDKINRKRLIGNTYQIYRSILHQLAIDENWNNVYSDITLPSGDMGTIKVERIDDEKKDEDV